MPEQPDQRMTAQVLRGLYRKSPRVVSDNFRIVHDPGPVDRWVYSDYGSGEKLVAVYPIVDAPRLGPIPVMSRRVEVDLPADQACREYFGGNREGWMVDKAAPDRSGPQPTGGLPFEEYQQQIQDAFDDQRQSYVAPQDIDPNDVLWDVRQMHDWFGVRIFTQRSPGSFSEDLILMSSPEAFPMHNRRWPELLIDFVTDFAHRNNRDLVDWEATDIAIKLNNDNVFTVSRLTRLSDEEYVKRYVRDVSE